MSMTRAKANRIYPAVCADSGLKLPRLRHYIKYESKRTSPSFYFWWEQGMKDIKNGIKSHQAEWAYQYNLEKEKEWKKIKEFYYERG